jgi:prepilin-type N-terminal cleavage/methylation domain-containing protein
MPQLTRSRRSLVRSRRGTTLRPSARQRRGMTLIEVMITMTLLSLVGAALTAILTRQQRFYRDAAETVVVRRELRGGASLIPADLRAVSTVGGDLLEATATSFTVRAAIGSGIVCAKPNAQTLDLVPQQLSNHTLTAWYTTPQVNDELFVFDEGTETGATDDSWSPHVLTAAPVADAGYCPGTPFVAAADAAQPKIRLALSGTVPATVPVGTVVRLTRRMRYSVYQPAGSTDWYLGFEEYDGSAYGAIQPIAGPLTASAGARFRYFNTAGAARTPTTQLVRDSIARIDVALRAAGRSDALGTRGGAGYTDSLLVRVGIRNFR